jgi:hypothetical protein
MTFDKSKERLGMTGSKRYGKRRSMIPAIPKVGNCVIQLRQDPIKAGIHDRSDRSS